MEARAPYHAAAEPAPRNLAAPLAAWLRRLGFTATEQQLGTLATVVAHWLSPRGERFELDYTWTGSPHADATCRLQVRGPWQLSADVLFTAQRVRRLKEARQLVTGNVRLHNARLLAQPAPAATIIDL